MQLNKPGPEMLDISTTSLVERSAWAGQLNKLVVEMLRNSTSLVPWQDNSTRPLLRCCATQEMSPWARLLDKLVVERLLRCHAAKQAWS